MAGLGVPVEVLAQDGDDQLRELNGPAPSGGLGRAGLQGSAICFGQRADDTHGGVLQVDIATGERGQLAPAQACEGAQQDQCLVPVADSACEPVDLFDGQYWPLGRFLLPGADDPARVTADQSVVNGGVEDRFERDGLAESDGAGQEGPQKRYRITDEGRQALALWLRTPPDLTSPPRDELVMKVLVAARVAGTDAHEVIAAHRVYLLELMQQWTRLKEGEARDDLRLALVVDAELFRLDAVIRWLDAAEVRLARAAAEPPRPASAPVPAPQLRRLGARR
jgi:DNA-binding PadR family transcriptional regulator